MRRAQQACAGRETQGEGGESRQVGLALGLGWSTPSAETKQREKERGGGGATNTPHNKFSKNGDTDAEGKPVQGTDAEPSAGGGLPTCQKTVKG